MTYDQPTLDFDGAADPRDAYDPATGLTPAEWAECAQWVLDHRRAASWVVKTCERINRPKDQGGEGRAASWRQDVEPELAKNAREYGLEGLYPGVDHNLSAPLARYFAVTRGLVFRLRARAQDNVKNATPLVA